METAASGEEAMVTLYVLAVLPSSLSCISLTMPSPVGPFWAAMLIVIFSAGVLEGSSEASEDEAGVLSGAWLAVSSVWDPQPVKVVPSIQSVNAIAAIRLIHFMKNSSFCPTKASAILRICGKLFKNCNLFEKAPYLLKQIRCRFPTCKLYSLQLSQPQSHPSSSHSSMSNSSVSPQFGQSI